DLAQITPECRILNIGCLTGYAAAILSKLGSPVFAIDTDAAAIEHAREQIKRLGINNVDCEHVNTMSEGYARSAPYDVVVICGGIRSISEALVSQLAIGGRMVAIQNVSTRPGVVGGLGKGLLIERIEHRLQLRTHFDASAAILPGFEQPSSFTL